MGPNYTYIKYFNKNLTLKLFLKLIFSVIFTYNLKTMIMAKSLEKEPMIIPNEYDGLWSAYYAVIIFYNGNKSHPIKLDEGVRGINCKCKVTVDKDGWGYVC